MQQFLIHNMELVNGNKKQTLYKEMTPRSRVPLEKLVLSQILLKKFRLLQQPNRHYHVHERLPLAIAWSDDSNQYAHPHIIIYDSF
jgi:hypothetical protein